MLFVRELISDQEILVYPGVARRLLKNINAGLYFVNKNVFPGIFISLKNLHNYLYISRFHMYNTMLSTGWTLKLKAVCTL